MTLITAVLVTWASVVVLSLGLGAFAGRLARSWVAVLPALRIALWIGFALLILAISTLNFFVPLRDSVVIVAVLILLVIGLLGLALVWRRPTIAFIADGRVWWIAIPVVVLMASLVSFAHHFAGPVESYDTGLYHLNAIQYAAEYRIIPGLANFHERLGTNVSSFLLAAFLGNGFW